MDDILQETFLRMRRGLHALRDDERFGPWLFTVARTAIADYHRHAARHPITETADDTALPIAEQGVDDDSVSRELATFVAPFVAALPSPYREALTLTELEGLSHHQAAEMSGVSLSAMKSRVQRGRARLRDLFDTCCEIALDARGRVIACEPCPDRSVPCECGRAVTCGS